MSALFEHSFLPDGTGRKEKEMSVSRNHFVVMLITCRNQIDQTLRRLFFVSVLPSRTASVKSSQILFPPASSRRCMFDV